MKNKGHQKEYAVSPVVGVMLMLVVTIIIAAVVSGFASGTISGQKKVPQATIQGTFSISQGMQITHLGGDALATSELVFLVRNNPVFGPNLEQKTSQILNKTLIADANRNYLDNGYGSTSVTSFASGDTLYINAANISCSSLQPIIYNSQEPQYCFQNSTSIGKTFSLEVSDMKGDLISQTDVTITA